MAMEEVYRTKADIINCDWTFKIQCPLNWQSLGKTDDKSIRQCGTCLRNVYLCRSDDEVALHAAKGDCVAFYKDAAFTKNAAICENDENVNPVDLWMGFVESEPQKRE